MYEDFMMLLIHLFQQNDNHIFVYNVWGSFSICDDMSWGLFVCQKAKLKWENIVLTTRYKNNHYSYLTKSENCLSVIMNIPWLFFM